MKKKKSKSEPAHSLPSVKSKTFVCDGARRVVVPSSPASEGEASWVDDDVA